MLSAHAQLTDVTLNVSIGGVLVLVEKHAILHPKRWSQSLVIQVQIENCILILVIPYSGKVI